MTTKGKCSEADGMCPTLAARSQFQDAPRGKGLRDIYLTSRATLKRRWAGVAYHTSAIDPGIVVNFCPWCGVPINFVEPKRTRRRAARSPKPRKPGSTPGSSATKKRARP